MRDLGAAQAAVLSTRLHGRDHELAATPAERAAALAALVKDDRAVDSAVAAYLPRAADPAPVGRFTDAWAGYRDLRDKQLIPADDRGDRAAAAALRTGSLREAAARADQALQDAAAAETRDAAKTLGQVHRTYSSARTLIILVLVLGLVLALGFGLLVSRMVTRSAGTDPGGAGRPGRG